LTRIDFTFPSQVLFGTISFSEGGQNFWKIKVQFLFLMHDPNIVKVLACGDRSATPTIKEKKKHKNIVKVLALRGHENGCATPFLNIYKYIVNNPLIYD